MPQLRPALLFLLIAAATIPAGLPSYARAGTVAETLLTIMYDKGQISAPEYRMLKRRAEQEERRVEELEKRAAEAEAELARLRRKQAVSAPAVAAVPAGGGQPPAQAAQTAAKDAKEAGPKAMDVKWKNGVQFATNDKTIKIKLSSRIKLDYATMWADRALRREFDEAGAGQIQGQGAEVRLARIKLQGEFYDRYLSVLEYDFAGGGSFKDVYLGMKGIPYVGTAVVGHEKQPFHLEQYMSDQYLTFMEASLDNAFLPDRALGVRMNNSFLDKRLWAGMGGFLANTSGDGKAFSSQANQQVTARVAGLPVYRDKGYWLLHAGLDYSHMFNSGSGQGSAVRFKTRPEIHLAPTTLDTGDMATEGADLYGAELAANLGPVNLQGEFAGAYVNQLGQTNSQFWGAYGQAAWFLTGEVRPYDFGKAAFGRVVPIEPFNPFTGQDGIGAWMLAARYSCLDLNSGPIRGGREQDVTAAVKWIMNEYFLMHMNYVHGWIENRDSAGVNLTGMGQQDFNALALRAELIF